MNTLDLSVVIAARNAAAELPRQLDALLSQHWRGNWEIVVVDNGSTDGTGSLVRDRAAEHDRVRLVVGPGGTAGEARNHGVRASSGSALAFCDSDDVVGDGWIAAMGDALRNHDFVNGPLELEHLNASWVAGSRGSGFATGPDRFVGVFPYASTCNMGVRREVFDRLGGFDESFPGGEDLELSMRLWLDGVALYHCDGAVVHYRYRTDVGDRWRQAMAHGAASARLLDALHESGVDAPSRLAGWRNWVWMVRHVGLVFDRAGRARWLRVAGTRVGALTASVRLRRLHL